MQSLRLSSSRAQSTVDKDRVTEVTYWKYPTKEMGTCAYKKVWHIKNNNTTYTFPPFISPSGWELAQCSAYPPYLWHLNFGPWESLDLLPAPWYRLFICSNILCCFQCQDPSKYLVWEHAGNRSSLFLFDMLSSRLLSVAGWDTYFVLYCHFYSPTWEKKSLAF